MTLGLLVAMAAAAPASNWTCAPFNCTCKGMGEYYGILAGVGFGCAPRPAESWWAEQKCPVSSSCSGGQTCCCKGAGCPAPAAHGGRGCAATAPCRACTCQPLPPPPLPPCAHDIPPAPTHPNWTSTYQLNRSTVVYACNYSGFFDSQFLSSFAVVGLDWSNVKAEWAAARPMDDDVRLTTQMAMIKKVDPTVKVTGYRNSIQAYNWMSIVREKMDDPACESPTCPPPPPCPFSLSLPSPRRLIPRPPPACVRVQTPAGFSSTVMVSTAVATHRVHAPGQRKTQRSAQNSGTNFSMSRCARVVSAIAGQHRVRCTLLTIVLQIAVYKPKHFYLKCRNDG